jgi:outer membrane receptor protein involved in Fe transport
MIKVGVGADGYESALAADSFKVGPGEFLYGLTAHRYDGPWTGVDENVKRNVMLLRYSDRTTNGGWNVALMGYDDSWNSADQIPRRAVDEGIIDRLGSLDTTLGGDTSRYSLSGSWAATVGPGRAHLNAYLIDYNLDLFSNFTYYLDDPVHGDQFEQLDDRTIGGGDFAYTFGRESGTKHTLGVMLRGDDIAHVGLYHTEARRRLDTIRDDSVREVSVGLYYSAETRWTDKIRTTLGARFDRYDFDVTSNLPENSGAASEMLLSPKANLIYSLGQDTELYASAGRGFHSNDARGTTITVDPTTGAPADKVSPLVPSHEIEFGFRSFVDRKLNISTSRPLCGCSTSIPSYCSAATRETRKRAERAVALGSKCRSTIARQIGSRSTSRSRSRTRAIAKTTRPATTSPARSSRSTRRESRCKVRTASSARCATATSARVRCSRTPA